VIELRVLGALDLRDGTGAEIGRVLAQPKRLALLAYLALTHASQQRGPLLALFWPELDEEHARLALRQAVHFLRGSLGTYTISSRSGDDLAIGIGTLRCDALEFQRALDDARPVDALDLYRGDLLPGFHADDTAPELEQWIDRERQRLRARAAHAAWALAEHAESGDNGVAAAHWARQAVLFAPDDEAGFRRLVSLLDRMGDRNGALRAYDELRRRLRSEFGVEPAAETRVLIENVRSREDPAQPKHQVSAQLPTVRAEAQGPVASPTGVHGGEASADVAESAQSVQAAVPIRGIARHAGRRRVVAIVLLGATLLGAGVAGLWSRRFTTAPPRAIAVGFIQNQGGDSTAETARILTGLLATDLARIRGLSVVSDARLYEILGQLGVRELTQQTFAEAARRAGAAELIEGILYRRPGGVLRLDLRRVGARDGVVREAYTADGANAFEVADRVTATIAKTFALTAPSTPLATAASGSIVSRRFYEEGLRAYFRGEWRPAYRLFSAALAEDSTFAMAAYYAARSIGWVRTDSEFVLLEKAEQLAQRAPDRDRLIIKHALYQGDYLVRTAIADSLTRLFPNEPEGHIAMSTLRVADGDFIGALSHARHVIGMDSLSFQGKTPVCRGCDAFEVLLSAYAAMGVDSFPAVERAAREWIQRKPESSSAWLMLAGALTWRGQHDDALEALNRATQLQPGLSHNYAHPSTMPAVMFASAVIKGEDYAEAERPLRDRSRFDQHDQEAIWWLVTTLRHQGRIDEALTLTAQAAQFAAAEGRSVALWDYVEAVLLFELGRFEEAAAQFHALMRGGPDDLFSAYATRRVSWYGVHAATAFAASGDTQRLSALADTMELVVRFGSNGLDLRFPHHVRGLLWQARGEPLRAVEEFRAAIYSPTLGFTRTNLELSRVFMSLGRPLEAIRILREALGGSSDGPGFALTRTEVHERLARGFEAAGAPDSAVAHYRKVAAAWRKGDPPYRARAEAARRKVLALER
jgi:DNA-binding SARP family transcriptional activator/TolB-like protein